VEPAGRPWGQTEFPVARILVEFSPAVGTVLAAAMRSDEAEHTGELAPLRLVIAQFQPGDVVAADRFFRWYWLSASLLSRGVSIVVRINRCRIGLPFVSHNNLFENSTSAGQRDASNRTSRENETAAHA